MNKSDRERSIEKILEDRVGLRAFEDVVFKDAFEIRPDFVVQDIFATLGV